MITSKSLFALISPYPTVDRVVNAQYIDARYIVCEFELSKSDFLIQHSGGNPCILADQYHRQVMMWTHNKTVMQNVINLNAVLFKLKKF